MAYYYACPSCGNDRAFSKPREESAAGTGLGILLFGGILAALLYSGNRNRRVQCNACHYIFQPPAPPTSLLSRLAGLGVLVFIALSVALWQGGALWVAQWIGASKPGLQPDPSAALHPLAAAIERNADAVATIGSTCAAGVATALAVLWAVGRVRDRIEFRRRYDYALVPPKRPERPRGGAKP